MGWPSPYVRRRSARPARPDGLDVVHAVSRTGQPLRRTSDRAARRSAGRICDAATNAIRSPRRTLPGCLGDSCRLNARFSPGVTHDQLIALSRSGIRSFLRRGSSCRLRFQQLAKQLPRNVHAPHTQRLKSSANRLCYVCSVATRCRKSPAVDRHRPLPHRHARPRFLGSPVDRRPSIDIDRHALRGIRLPAPPLFYLIFIGTYRPAICHVPLLCPQAQARWSHVTGPVRLFSRTCRPLALDGVTHASLKTRRRHLISAG
jgi:hypothetical protein